MNPVQSRQPGIVERLRSRINDAPLSTEVLLDEAAARIEELESNERAYEAALGERTYNEVAANIADLRTSLDECLGQMGWTNYTDAEIEREALLGNGRAPIILRAREALQRTGT